MEQLQGRVSSLKAALSDFSDDLLPVIAAGHSVGGRAALCLAGGQPWTRDGRAIAVPTEERVSQLVLFAPSLGWFQPPGALARVYTPITVHAGVSDTITPAVTAELLRAAPATVNIRIHENVGHYDFMTELPPTVAPTVGLDQDAFLRELADYTSADLGAFTLPS